VIEPAADDGGSKDLDTLLAQAGLGPEEFAEHQAAGTVGLAILSRLVFPDEPRYTVAQLGELSGTGDETLVVWRGLGFPDPSPDEAVFTDADVAVFRFVQEMVSGQLTDLETSRAINRVIGNTMARLAAAMVEAVGDRVAAASSEGDESVARLAADQAHLLSDPLGEILLYVWRRHLVVALRRRLAQPPHVGAVNSAVGFCDLVGFTRLSQQITDAELSAVVYRFESTVVDVVSGFGGRVVKNIGDEAMFCFPDPEPAVEVGLRLAEIHHYDEMLPELRVGIGYGPVLTQEGDLYGPVVNKASRIVPLGRPGTVLVADEVATALAGNDRFVFDALRLRTLKDIGREQLWRVQIGAPDNSRSEWRQPLTALKDRLSGR
jgi:adenylate cyclase